MKTYKALILGSAAGLLAVGGAQAADLPLKAKAVEYVKICSLYGAGFYYIPGTDTCIRIGGAIRLDVAFNAGTYDSAYWLGSTGGTSASGAQAFGRNYFAERARFNLTEDTRTATEYGVLRTYANVQMDWIGGSSGIAGGGPVEVDYAFIQFAGFTMGKSVSMFDTQWVLSKPTISSGFFSGSNNATGISQLAYTWSLGNGVSGTLSVEDGQPYRTAGVVNTSLGGAGMNFLVQSQPSSANLYGVGTFAGNEVAGDHVPEIVGNIRLDQAWGDLHFGAAAHEVHGTYYGSTAALQVSDAGHPGSTWGYAVTGAFELKNLPTGAGDTLRAEATFAHGAAKYVFGGTLDADGAARFARSSGTDPGTLALGYVLDGIYTGTNGANGTSISLSNAWSADAWFEHYWNPQWRTSVFGAFSHISYGAAGNAFMTSLATGSTLGTLTLTNSSADLSTTQIGTKTSWMPVKDLTFSAEFIYSRIAPSASGTFSQGGSATATGFISGASAGGIWTLGAQNVYNGAVQVIRSF
jgi:Porin subfamily